jgi:hypothetical protein
MDLNNHVPCVCDECRKNRDNNKIDLTNTMYFKLGQIPDTCPLCGTEGSIRETIRICLVHEEVKAKVYRASPAAMKQYKGRIKGWKYYCGRSCDEHSRDKIPTHTCLAECANCPECMVKYQETLELADTLLRVRT